MTGVGLAPGVRLVHDQARGQHALLYPEGVLLLNETAAAVLRMCDARRRPEQIAAALAERYDGVPAAEVAELLDRLRGERLLTAGDRARPAVTGEAPAGEAKGLEDPSPLGMLAELTYRCPLQCGYCSNPVNLAAYRDELDVADWRRVLDQARGLGVLQVHLSGGEPLIRRDLAELVTHARRLGMYTNLITSGVGLTRPVLTALVGAGLDHVQLSIQDAEPQAADRIAGRRAHDRKRAAAALIRRHGLPLTINVVLHRATIDHLIPIAQLAADWGADRLELAHAQFYGWGMVNRAGLLPTREQVARADAAVGDARRRFGRRMVIGYVRGDWYDGRPKPCMQGWGNRQLVVAPNGDVLPCPAASVIDDLRPVNVRQATLADIWRRSEAFNRFRGEDWMREPCRGCALRHVDFGGCRCQAYQLAGDAAATDPACALSPHHGLVEQLISEDSASVALPLAPRRWR